jgi:hypothetical protein
MERTVQLYWAMAHSAEGTPPTAVEEFAAISDRDLVRSVLWGWATNDGTWVTSIPWQRIEA